ncbi:methyl-accepting chemotaxis protein [Leptothrix discophora]|uniref:Methyl-accepting chemotaxis protein n=1 Tax=Leptothrix discophora TaxID=89 RepID=A0ABT9G6S1_LEPDI|nr:methyl-accepting chemotaxis protein [Leptothrix discophora]MDP4302164.1 methyl-accepting chemotaxis protein [Leptothrix discophora]
MTAHPDSGNGATPAAAAAPRTGIDLLAATGCLACAAVATLAPAGPIAVGLALTGSLATGWLVRRLGRHDGAAPASAAQAGARLMVSRVVPVWKRHIEASRDEAGKQIDALLQNFSSLSDGLSVAAREVEGTSLSLRAGTTDEVVEVHAGAIDALLEPMHEATRQRRAMVDEIASLHEELQALQRLVKDVRQIAANTGLVALNASIEAHRAGREGQGFTVVAQEVRSLANQCDRNGAQLAQRIQKLSERIEQTRNQALAQTRSDEEIDLRARLQAREVVAVLVRDLSRSLESSRELQSLSVRLGADLEQIFVGFQFQDRLTQMLDAIGNDMQRFAGWIEVHDEASHADAARWLEDLERTYTMEEQRNHHHGTVDIQRNSGVEFF